MYVGLSKHSIIKTFLLVYTLSALFIWCFHHLGCVGESILGRAVILPVRLSSSSLCRRATGTKPDFSLNPFPCWNKATHQNRAPVLFTAALMVGSTHRGTWIWSLYWGGRGLVQADWWGCNQKNYDRLDKRLKEGKEKPMSNPIRCARETELMGNLKFSSTEDTSETSLAPFTAVKGNQLLILLL